MFHATYGYYAQGVETSTATLTDGWRDRLVAVICQEATPIAVGWCLERHDLWVSKAAAGREKDIEFCRALATAGLVEEVMCRARIMDLSGADRSRAEEVLRRCYR